MSYFGETCALLASVFWAGSNFAFQSKMGLFSPMMLNFAKCSISSVVIFILLYFFDIELFPQSEITPYIRLMLSGICGIAIGDSFFLAALNELGARKTLLIETLAPPITGIIAYFYYGTTISLIGWVGVALTLYGLYIVVVEKEPSTTSEQPPITEPLIELSNLSSTTNSTPTTPLPIVIQAKAIIPESKSAFYNKGILFGVAAMFCQSVGIVLSSSVLSTGQFNSLCATLIRIAPSNLVLYPILKYYKKETFEWPRLSIANNINLITTILVSTIFCIWMSQLSLVYTRPEISQTLIATSPLFGLMISRMKGETISMKQVLGSFISVFGVFLIVQV